MLEARERAVDALYGEAEELASREVLLQAPVAADLRFLLSVLRVAPELERSHDLVMQIASAAARSPGRWESWHPPCGSRRRTPGTRGTPVLYPRWASAARR